MKMTGVEIEKATCKVDQSHKALLDSFTGYIKLVYNLFQVLILLWNEILGSLNKKVTRIKERLSCSMSWIVCYEADKHY